MSYGFHLNELEFYVQKCQDVLTQAQLQSLSC